MNCARGRLGMMMMMMMREEILEEILKEILKEILEEVGLELWRGWRGGYIWEWGERCRLD